MIKWLKRVKYWLIVKKQTNRYKLTSQEAEVTVKMTTTNLYFRKIAEKGIFFSRAIPQKYKFGGSKGA